MRILRSLLAATVVLALAAPAWAQAVTASEIQALELKAEAIEARLPTLKRSDVTLAGQVEKSLGELRDEITYMKVKLRRDSNVPRADFKDVSDRLETLRIKAQAQVSVPSSRVQAQPTANDPIEKIWTVPVGTMLDVRLQTPLNSGSAKVEQRFEATTVTDVVMGKDTVIPAGTTVRGFVSSVKAAGTIDRKGSITLSFDEIRIGTTTQKLRASVSQALDGKMGGEVGKIGAGAVVGGIIGGILGGGKGALAGVLIGGGGTMAATEGANVDLPVGTVLRLRIDQPLDVSVR